MRRSLLPHCLGNGDDKDKVGRTFGDNLQGKIWTVPERFGTNEQKPEGPPRLLVLK